MAEHPDVLVLGGGVIGLTTAYFLAREGVQVEVVDKGDLGREASWAGAGILPPGNPEFARTPIELLHAHSAALFPTLSAELRERTNIDNGYLACGGLEFVPEKDGALIEELRRLGVPVEALDVKAVHQIEPAVAAWHRQVFWLPTMAQVRNPRHVKALVAGCQGLGVRLRPGCPVYGLERHDGRVSAARTGVGPLAAGQFLVAAGAWTDGLLEPLGWRTGIRPVRGQVVLLNGGVPLFRRILQQGKRYLVPRPDGRVLVGSTEEDAGFSKQTTAWAVEDLLEFAVEMVSALAEAHVERCWAGLRPGSPDGLPLLGPVPEVENLYVAAGHFRSGIQLSPATARVLTELVLGRELTVPLEPFRLDRKPPVTEPSPV
jgi:glycine oxidase